MDMKPWLDRVTGSPPAVVAKRIGLSTSTFDGQLKSATGLKPDTVVKIAREFESDPVAALVELGLLHPNEVEGGHDLSEADHLAWLRAVSDEILLTEIGRRFDERHANDAGADSEESPGEAPAARAAQRRRPKGERIDIGGHEPIEKSRSRASRGRS